MLFEGTVFIIAWKRFQAIKDGKIAADRCGDRSFRFGHGVHCSWKFITYIACDRVAREWSLPTDNCNRSCAAWTAAAAVTRADWLSAQTRPERLEFSSAVRTKSPSAEMIRKMTSSARRC